MLVEKLQEKRRVQQRKQRPKPTTPTTTIKGPVSNHKHKEQNV
jgi:hypothetical protein